MGSRVRVFSPFASDVHGVSGGRPRHGGQDVAGNEENDAILEKQGALGVDYVQGYGIHKPCPMEQCLEGFCDAA